MTNSLLDFNGEITQYDNLGEVKVPKPWVPYWYPHLESQPSGIQVRPAYYPERLRTYNGLPTLAIRTTYATHTGGVLVGPYYFESGTQVKFDITGMMETGGEHVGDGTLSAIATRDRYEGAVSDFNPIYGIELFKPYHIWHTLSIELVTDKGGYWFGVQARWKWASQLCLTLLGNAMLTWVEPSIEVPVSQLITFRLGQYIVSVKLEDTSQPQ